jgi:hypothetical protein
MSKIISKIASRRAESLLKEESSMLTQEEVAHLLRTVLKDEKSVRVFCRTLLSMDIAEAKSGNDDANRMFISCAMRVAYVYFTIPGRRFDLLPAEEPPSTPPLEPPLPDGQ